MVMCPARSLEGKRVPRDWRWALAEGWLLLLSNIAESPLGWPPQEISSSRLWLNLFSSLNPEPGRTNRLSLMKVWLPPLLKEDSGRFGMSLRPKKR